MISNTTKPKQMEAYDKFEVTGDGYILHDDDYLLNGEEGETIYDNPIKDIRRCNFCKTIIEKVENNTLQEKKHRDFCIWYCQNCRFWQTRLYSAYSACYPPPDNWIYKSKLREFNPNLPNGCDEELALHIRRYPDLVYSFKPTRFEKFVADVFKANYANAEVLHVGKPHDGGADVLFIDVEKKQWLIQVKHRRSAGTTIGIGTIRDLLGAMHLNGVRRGIVVSNADRFSQYAQQAADDAATTEFPMIVQLVNNDILDEMLNPILPDRPWLNPISEIDEEIANYLADQIPCDQQLSGVSRPNL